tara:strand:- start:63 stop:389 length:327 start_codon:yes stop_codon:yes gene_type:complete
MAEPRIAIIETLRQTSTMFPCYDRTGAPSLGADTCVTGEDVKAVIRGHLEPDTHTVEVTDDVVEGILQACVWEITEAIQEAVDGVVEEACAEVIKRMKKQDYTLEEEA